MERLEIIGYIGADVREIDYQGAKFYTINVGVSRKLNNEDQTFWYGCNFNTLSDKLKPYLVKGQCVYVCGQPRYRIFDSAKFHQKIVGVEIFVERVELVGKRPDSNTNETNSQNAANPAPNENDGTQQEKEPLPF